MSVRSFVLENPGMPSSLPLHKPVSETKFSGTYGDREMFIFPVQLTTSRIGNLTRLIHTLLYVMWGRINASGI